MSRALLRWAGLAVGLHWGLRLHWRQQPRPFPRCWAPVLHSRLRRRYLDPETLTGLFGVTPGMTVLELGCGTGLITHRLAQDLGASGRLIALDIQADLLAQARRRIADAAPAARVEFHQADARTAPLAAHSVDLIVLGSVLGELPDIHACLTRLFEVAKPRSRLVAFEEVLNPGYVPPGMARMHLQAAGFRQGGQLRQWTHYLAVYFKDEVAFNAHLQAGFA